MAQKELLLAVDGPGVDLSTVDTVLLLRLATACFQLTTKVSSAMGAPLGLNGIAVRDGSAMIGAVPTKVSAASLAASRVAQIISGQADAPDGAAGELQEILACLRALPDHHTASVRLGTSKHELLAPALPERELPWSRTELRVIPLRVGGSGKVLKALLWSESEAKPFSLDIDLENARKLGLLLHDEVDVALEIARGIDGNIEAGRVLEVFELQEGGSEAWRAWFTENAFDWDAVDDVRAELGRD
jgi:hypothetical protein